MHDTVYSALMIHLTDHPFINDQLYLKMDQVQASPHLSICSAGLPTCYLSATPVSVAMALSQVWWLAAACVCTLKGVEAGTEPLYILSL